MQIVVVIVHALFLSTLSLRRATVLVWCSCGGACDFYPRSPCGERQRLGLPGWLRVLISIHALLAESDRRRTYQQGEEQAFLSTLSLRRATSAELRVFQVDKISIHALLAESDALRIFSSSLKSYFYPRSPCGERL